MIWFDSPKSLAVAFSLEVPPSYATMVPSPSCGFALGMATSFVDFRPVAWFGIA